MDCNICLDTFNPNERCPKFLPCGHSFCLKCLLTLEERRCPLDRKEFREAPVDLPTAFFSLGQSTGAGWCLDCDSERGEFCGCGDFHTVCTSMRAAVRGGRVRPLLDGLRDAAALWGRLGRLLQTPDLQSPAVDGLLARAETLRVEAEAGLQTLRDALDAAPGVFAKAEQAAELVVARAQQSELGEGLKQLLEDPESSCSLSVTRGRGRGQHTWRAEVRLGDSALARLLLAALALDGRLHADTLAAGNQGSSAPVIDITQWEERSNVRSLNGLDLNDIEARMTCRRLTTDPHWTNNTALWPARVGTVDMYPASPAEGQKQMFKVDWESGESTTHCFTDLNLRLTLEPLKRFTREDIFTASFISILELSSDPEKVWESDLISSSRLKEVKKLAGLRCDMASSWSREVLESATATLEELEVLAPQPQHLRVVSEMARLVKLHIESPEGGDDVPLPPQVQELRIARVTRVLLQRAAALPRLVRLDVHCPFESPVTGVMFARPAAPRLEWLRCGVHPLSTALSLVRAHAATLKELQLEAATEEPYGCPDLPARLAACGLTALQRLVLVRQCDDGTICTAFCENEEESCSKQKSELFNALIQTNIDVNITVVCNECDKVDLTYSL